MTMGNAVVGSLLVAAFVLAAAPPPVDAQDLDHSLSASRDAPVFELAYGPRGQLSIGRAVAIWEGTRLALGISALAALEDARAHTPFPTELGRLVIDVGLAWRLAEPAEQWFGVGGELVVRFALGMEHARKLGGVEAELLLPQPQPGDIPFGGGGNWIAFELAGRVPVGDDFSLSIGLRERVFLNAWPLLVGDRAVSDDIANFLGEGLAHAPSLDLTLSWRATSTLRPLAAAFAEGLFPHDRSAQTSGFGRLLAGVAIASAGGEVIPFTSLDIGSGKGLLINRHELRLSLGVRFVF
jgi:hypothetical protein